MFNCCNAGLNMKYLNETIAALSFALESWVESSLLESVSRSFSVEARFALRTLPLALSVMVSVWFLVRRQNVDCDFTLRLELTCSTGFLKDPRVCDRALTSARRSPRSSTVAHVAQPTRAIDILVSGAVDGVEGAVAQLQPLTVQQGRYPCAKEIGRVDGVTIRLSKLRPSHGSE